MAFTRVIPLQQGIIGRGSGMSGGGMTSGGGGSSILNNLIQQLQGSQDQANTANLAQYQNLLSSANRTSKDILGKGGYFSKAGALLQNMGNTARADTRENIANQLGQTEQDLISRGLGNTTIRSNMLSGVQNRGQRELNQIDEAVGTARSGLMQNQAGMALDLGRFKADSILSRMNEGPDMSLYLQLIRQLAEQQGAGQHQTITSNMGSITEANSLKPIFGR